MASRRSISRVALAVLVPCVMPCVAGCAPVREAIQSLDDLAPVTLWERCLLLDKLPLLVIACIVGGNSEKSDHAIFQIPIFLLAWPVVEVRELLTGSGPWHWVRASDADS